MAYRIMQIGDKFGAQLVDSEGEGYAYISHDGTGNWIIAKSIINRCLVPTKEEAEALGNGYTGDDYCERLMATARIVT